MGTGQVPNHLVVTALAMTPKSHQTDLDGGPFQVHGEVATGYRRVSLICWDGTQVDTTVLDCIDILGFNV